MTIKSICIYGAGALGGAIAVKLASRLGDDVTVSVVARGAHLAAIREGGLSLHEADADRPIMKASRVEEAPASSARSARPNAHARLMIVI